MAKISWIVCGFLVVTVFVPAWSWPRADKRLDEWRKIAQVETLDVFLKDKRVGTLVHSLTVMDDTKALCATTDLAVEAGQGGTMALSERRLYDADGKLRSARQAITGESGTNEWRLDKAAKTWLLTVVAGGVVTHETLATVKENIIPTLNLYKSIKASLCRVGDMFRDTAFDLVSHKTIATICRCTGVSAARDLWTFDIIDDLTSRSQRWELDADARTLSQEIEGVFVARKKIHGQQGAAAPATQSDLADIFSVRKDRPPLAGERIALTFQNGLAPDSSVATFFRKSGDRWQLSDFAKQCGANGSDGDTALLSWTRPTVTIQSDYPAIVSLSRRLAFGKNDRCAIIDTCTKYVFSSLAKRNTATFSNAVETLKAGFGDCGEHAVLLAAILRAAGVPARVVLGLIYYGPKKAFAGHAWVMAFAGGRWIFCDPAFGVFPAAGERVPLVIDDNGAHAVLLARYIGRIGIDYVRQ